MRPSQIITASVSAVHDRIPVHDGDTVHPELALAVWVVPATVALVIYSGLLPSSPAGFAAGAAIALAAGLVAGALARRAATCPYLNPTIDE